MMIALDQIDFLPTALRRSAEPDAGFVESIRNQGVLQPVLLRPTGNRYEVVKGERRVRAARLADLTEIPAHIDAALVGHHATVARLAATMARRPLTTTEQWRALCTLTDDGFGIEAAAVAVGIEPRTARQMERLGRLHPELLAEYERIETDPDPETRTFGLPDWSDLGAIANATPDEQMAAARASGFPDELNWEALARRLDQRRAHIPRAWALFHPDMVKWTEDLFAEPGSDEQFTTDDAEAFVAAQRLALADLANASKGRLLMEVGKDLWFKPTGTAADAWGNDKPTKLENNSPRTIHAWVLESGPLRGRVRWVIARKLAAEPAPEPPPADMARDPDSDDLDEHVDELAADDAAADEARSAPQPEPEPDGKLPLTKHGQTLLAKARTEALRAALRDPERRYSYDDLVAMLVVALAAGTVAVKSGHGAYDHRVDMSDLAGRANDKQGRLRPDVDPGRLAQEALARMLCLPGPDQVGGYNQPNAYSATIPAAIGAIVGADAHLPRLDTEEFLATVTGAELKAWAKAEGVKLTKVTEIRDRMQGRAEAWRPAWALFAPDEAEGAGA